MKGLEMLNSTLRAVCVIASAASVASLSACAVRVGPAYAYQPAPVYVAPPLRADAPVSEFGVVRSINAVPAAQTTTGSGALLGAVIGAVVGKQFGSDGFGHAAGAAIGLVGGAAVGNEIEKQQTGATDRLHVAIRLDSGQVLVAGGRGSRRLGGGLLLRASKSA